MQWQAGGSLLMVPHTGLVPLHTAHVPPLPPHALFDVPAWHVWLLERQQPVPPQLPQFTVPLHPFGIEPHCPAAHVIAVQPQMPAVPPPPHVSGEVQLEFELQPHAPLMHAVPLGDDVHTAHEPPGGPHAPGVLPVWQLVPSQQAPLHVRPPVHDVLHVLDDEHALPVGQSPAAPHPQVPPSWHTWPADCVEQSVHSPPLTPQSVPPAAPVWQRPDVASQHPVLHVSVTPPTTQLFEHECVETLQAWLTGQSALVLQPHWPPMHWLEPLHGPQLLPLVPQDCADVFVLQLPLESQHPVGQVVGVQFATQVPAVEHACEAVHVTHEAPLMPQLALPEVRHWPEAEQQPAGHEVGVQGTATSAPPLLLLELLPLLELLAPLELPEPLLLVEPLALLLPLLPPLLVLLPPPDESAGTVASLASCEPASTPDDVPDDEAPLASMVESPPPPGPESVST